MEAPPTCPPPPVVHRPSTALSGRTRTASHCRTQGRMIPRAPLAAVAPPPPAPAVAVRAVVRPVRPGRSLPDSASTAPRPLTWTTTTYTQRPLANSSAHRAPHAPGIHLRYLGGRLGHCHTAVFITLASGPPSTASTLRIKAFTGASSGRRRTTLAAVCWRSARRLRPYCGVFATCIPHPGYS